MSLVLLEAGLQYKPGVQVVSLPGVTPLDTFCLLNQQFRQSVYVYIMYMCIFPVIAKWLNSTYKQTQYTVK